MPRILSWIIWAMWVANAAGLFVNMTSSDPLPAGGTAVFVWSQDNATVNPSQFTLYIVPASGSDEHVVGAQLVNAGSQLSGTVTMVVPPETSLGVYDALAYIGTDSPTVGTGPALWGNEFKIAAAVQSGGSSPSSGAGASNAGISSASNAAGLSSAGGPSGTLSSAPSRSASATGLSASTSALGSTSTAVNGTGASSTSPTGGPSAVPQPKHGLPVGAIVGIVLGLILALLGIGLLFLYLRWRRRRARVHGGPAPLSPSSPSLSFPAVTPFPASPPAPSMAQVQVARPIMEKDTVVGSYMSTVSPTTESASGSSSGSGGSSASSAAHAEALARLEREVQMLRAQQQLQSPTFSEEPPPGYNTL
ncbi:hypothetical protein DFH08DRAFT_907647 [Mycena albidolilacea]|uniref:Uncharacterized protein n=1 Tax=Mycena albidolilacea TaxID=1033008 RepID=A0AAD7E7B6_9AGAR|nr:hypothetical protein DFH08DRAFT_907647 [Mycena albidolilacea]